MARKAMHGDIARGRCRDKLCLRRTPLALELRRTAEDGGREALGGSGGILCASHGLGMSIRVRFAVASSWVCVTGYILYAGRDICSTRDGEDGKEFRRNARRSDSEDAPKVADIRFKGRRGLGKSVVCLYPRG